MNDLQSKLSRENLRLTQARKDVFTALTESSTALTAMDLHKALNSDTDLTSVYRNLALFEKIGLVHRLAGDRYTACDVEENCHHDHANPCDHTHFLMSCFSCGTTTELAAHSTQLSALARQLKSQTSLESLSSIVLQGHCKSCSSK